MPVAIPDIPDIALAGITEPSDIVIPSSIDIEAIAELRVEAAEVADPPVGSLSHAMVTGGRLGVGIGTAEAALVMEEDWARTSGAVAAPTRA